MATASISWGIGVYRDPSNLDILTRSLTGTRTDSFYDATGTNLLQPPVLSTFTINPNQLRFSYVTNASVAFEQKLPKTTYLRVELMDRRARNIWTFLNPGASTLPDGPFSGQFILTNDRHDHYDSAGVTLRHVFKQNHVVFASYTRSRALTNADFGTTWITCSSARKRAAPWRGTRPIASSPGDGCRSPARLMSLTPSTGAPVSPSP